MTHSMYQASVPVFVRGLRNLADILTKGLAYAQARKIEPSVLVNARLYPDMLPLARQVQIATDHAKNASSRLAAAERPAFEDNESTFEQLQERIAKTIAYVESLSPAQFDGSENRDVTLPVRGKDVSFKGEQYLNQFALPNFYFHAVTAYAILRHNGADIGKLDFLGAMPT